MLFLTIAKKWQITETANFGGKTAVGGASFICLLLYQYQTCKRFRLDSLIWIESIEFSLNHELIGIVYFKVAWIARWFDSGLPTRWLNHELNQIKSCESWIIWLTERDSIQMMKIWSAEGLLSSNLFNIQI